MATVKASDIAAIFDKLRDQRDAAIAERDAARAEVAALRAIAQAALAYDSPYSYDAGTEDYEQVYQQALKDIVSETQDA